MQITAKAKNIRMSARKVRLVVDVIRGRDVQTALDQLQQIVRAAALPVRKVLLSALANAQHNFQAEESNLIVQKAYVDQGAQLKRWRPRAFGRAAPIKKHSCHITVVLGEKEEKKSEVRTPAKGWSASGGKSETKSKNKKEKTTKESKK
ncbi:50S ribosomal protein L22 [Candidatus Uhrbacteria bacterium]|nr:50S ribosomal protein L22 [Candidatus Uhrbacteria bacterium]